MKLELDRASAVPLTDQIVAGVQAWIRSRAAHPGARLPSIRQFAADYRISRFPVIEAYDRLVSLGYLDSRHGSGFYVSEHARADAGSRGACDLARAADESVHILRQLNRPGEMLELDSGSIPQSWRDIDALAQAIRHVSRTDPSSLVDYAPPFGDPTLREHLRNRLAPLGIVADAQQILITEGASEGLDLLMRYLLKPGDTAFVEDPGYYNLFGLLKLHGVQLVGIPRNADGPDLERLNAMLALHRPRVFFVNPVFHNPTGTTIAPPVAFRLLQLAREHRFTIVEDDIYADFQTDASDRLAALDQFEHVVYVGGLSKTLSSSLRVGYVVADPAITRDLASIKALTSISGSRFAQAVAVALLERGAYRKYLDRLRRRIGDALGAAIATLEDHGWELFARPSGGKFVWARVPHVDDSERLAACGEPLGVHVSPGGYFRPDGGPSPWIRINAAFVNDPRAQAFFAAAVRLAA
ncbi:PLP-dependent aminotransferase family protein [Paraburkholderia caballeronis]|uniref:DNA-binding transcriptional regulator, MocR family, contains an aminotransferase domain n=1 Tax=Paraburkholderia caballeronis TaxID=416943 RepID=A0A1H7PLN3_9BURK|nr:PLP-dependent aminotransferase family protein [Paraburkholderia caballeronis]PXW24230.1 GntR family transcriptional regulator [Paraburkholderia caballeronis]PXX00012.1 GntR family transcriptional regulator [Paraburkholderia caballeronis]RAJ97141.1 GntR family transcriptional regulator [Paraburkholderia caballeronis]TDV08280.1 GntR family transcriptional regulator [Paraburkholderia caballeronis]TDV11972.1 GntR family transcriptional regulator [Paraburkholderia caballeronis]